LQGKIAAVVSASPGAFGGVRSLTLARQLLIHLGCHVVPTQCVLPQANKAFDETGALKEERHRKSVLAVATELVRVTRALSG
jgi:chromate reductase